MTTRSESLTRRRRSTMLGGSILLSTAVNLLPASAASINLSGNYEETVNKSCASVTQCTVTFASVEAGKQFVVANASCNANAGTSTNLLIYMYLGTKTSSGGELLRRTFLTPVLLGGPTRYVANNQLTKNYDQNEVPIIKLGVNGPGATNFAITCTIAGAKFSP